MIIGIDASRAFGPFVGGPENYSYYLIRAMLKAGSPHQFRLYLRSDSSKSPRFNAFFSGLPTTNYQLQTIPWSYLWTQMGLALECLVNPPDLLFVPAHTLPVIRRSGFKTMVTIHDLGAQFLPNYHKFPQKYYLNFATEFAINNATKIVAVSEYTKADITGKFKVQSAKCKVVYEGYDRELFYPRSEEEIVRVKAKYGIQEDYFLFVGTIQPRKNLVRLIEAFSQLISKSEYRNSKEIQNPNHQNSVKFENSSLEDSNIPSDLGFRASDLTLVLAGSPGWLNQEIYAAPKRFGVENLVKFTGKVPDEDLPALMTGSKAFVFPSLYEGFGLSLLEALACGAITVSSKITSLPEVGGQAPFYIDPNDTRSIIEALRQVWNLSEDERAQKRKEGIAQAAKFSWENAAIDVLSLIDSIR